MKKVQLYSGGMDSYIISKLWKPDVMLYIDYCSKQNEMEKKHLPQEAIIKKFDLNEYTENDGHHTIPLRNLIFAAIAVNYGDEILIGGLKSDLHHDKTPEFAASATSLFNSVLNKERSGRRVRVIVPYASYTKTELVKAYYRLGGTRLDIEENSWSCHEPRNGKPCGRCQACKAREKALDEADGILSSANLEGPNVFE